jgi:hypothetical protein
MTDVSLVPYLNLQGYNPIAVPREQFDPLFLIGGTSRTNLKFLGRLPTLLKPGTPLPEVFRDDEAPAFGNRLSDSVDAKAGLHFLGAILAAFGAGSLGVSGEYSKAATLEYLFLNVKHDYVAPLEVAAALTLAALNPAVVANVQGFPFLYLVSDTLKSNLFAVVAFDDKNAKIELNADAIKQIVGGDVSVGVANGQHNVVSYSGTKELRFAFRAIPLKLYADKEPELQIDDAFLVARAVPAKTLPPEAYEVLAPGTAVDITE